MQHISSICTDGTNSNTGEKAGLWKLFEDEIRRIESDVPLMKIWCSAHRMELVWGDTCKAHVAINKILNEVSSISSYFHQSGLRTSALKKVAEENNFKFLSLPKLFTIRWTEFSASIIENVLRSWRALVAYFDKNKEDDCVVMGYFKFLSKIDNLRIMSFLGDLLQIYSRHHKRLQDDKLTIVSLMQSVRSLRNALNDLEEKQLTGGWEEALTNDFEEIDGKLLLKGVELQISDGRKRKHVDFNSIREAVIKKIIERLSDRFDIDETRVNLIEPFVMFDENANLRAVYGMFGSDLELSALQLQFNELKEQNIASKLGGNFIEIIKTLLKNQTCNNYKEMATVLGRI